MRDAARLNAAVDALLGLDPALAAAHARIGYPVPRAHDPGFATLLRIVVGQQISTHAAAAIWHRLEAAAGGSVAPASFLALDDSDLRAVGFSLRKAVYARDLALAVADGRLAVDRFAGMSDDEAVAAIAALRGFGRWSAEVYLLFALGRPDIFPAGDLALQVAAQRLAGLPERPSEQQLRLIAEAWKPWRGAAAIFLWHYYGAATLDGTG